jgi:hypothetical protein
MAEQGLPGRPAPPPEPAAPEKAATPGESAEGGEKLSKVTSSIAQSTVLTRQECLEEITKRQRKGMLLTYASVFAPSTPSCSF